MKFWKRKPENSKTIIARGQKEKRNAKVEEVQAPPGYWNYPALYYNEGHMPFGICQNP